MYVCVCMDSDDTMAIGEEQRERRRDDINKVQRLSLSVCNILYNAVIDDATKHNQIPKV